MKIVGNYRQNRRIRRYFCNLFSALLCLCLISTVPASELLADGQERDAAYQETGSVPHDNLLHTGILENADVSEQEVLQKEGGKEYSFLIDEPGPAGIASEEDSAEDLITGNAPSVAEPAQNQIGPNVFFSLDIFGTGLMTISGTGPMFDNMGSAPPYMMMRSYIKRIVVEPGVTTIGNDALGALSHVDEVVLPASVNRIGKRSFDVITALDKLVIGNSSIIIWENAFDSTKIKDVYFNGTKAEWDSLKISPGNETLLNANIHFKPDHVPMHRLYNPYSGEHFYTANTDEKNQLVSIGWTYEGIGWNAPASDGAPVIYRLYNPKKGFEEHHYTADLNEIKVLTGQGWKLEGPAWGSDPFKGVPVYRLFFPYARNSASSHHYTTDANEKSVLTTNYGWRYEGIGWYGCS